MLRQCVSVNGSHCYKNIFHQIRRENISCMFEVFQQVGNWSFHVVYSNGHKKQGNEHGGSKATETSAYKICGLREKVLL